MNLLNAEQQRHQKPSMAITTVLITTTLMSVFAVTMALEKGELLDMSYPFDDSTLYWPGSGSFHQIVQSRGPGLAFGFPWYEANAFSAAEHGGTHIDAPAHMSEGKLRVHEIPIEKMVGPAVRIDISEKAEADRDYGMIAKDLQDWEEVYGKIPDGALLFVYSGWGQFYPDRLAYFGSARNDTHLSDQGESLVHFPGMAPDAAAWLVANRKISGVGTDAPSLDPGPGNADVMTHRTLFAANIYGLENVANLDKLPNTGAKVYALPMKIVDGSGAPARIVAMLDEGCTSSAATLSAACTMLLSLIVLGMLTVVMY